MATPLGATRTAVDLRPVTWDHRSVRRTPSLALYVYRVLRDTHTAVTRVIQRASVYRGCNVPRQCICACA